MRIKLLFTTIISLTLFMCDEYYTPEVLGDAPYKGKEGAAKVIDEKGANKIKIRYTNWMGYNVYHSNDVDTFLLNVCEFDCNEFIKKKEWSNDESGDYYSILFENSDRFEGKSRLVLYSFKETNIKEMLDIKDYKVTDFLFNDSTFVYTEASGDEITIELE